MTSTRPQHARAQSAATAEQRSGVSPAQTRRSRAKSLRIDEARAARLARHACGLTLQQLADQVGVRMQAAAEWEHPDCDRSPRFDHMRCGPRDWRRFFTRELAKLDGDLVISVLPDGLTDAEGLHRLLNEMADVLRVAALPSTDQHREQFKRELAEMIDAAQARLVALSKPA